jgi:hypothetical protein
MHKLTASAPANKGAPRVYRRHARKCQFQEHGVPDPRCTVARQKTIQPAGMTQEEVMIADSILSAFHSVVHGDQ